MICYNESIWDASVFHLNITCTQYLFILVTYWVPLVNLLSYLLMLSLPSSLSFLSLPHPSLFRFSETGSCLPVQTGHKFVVIFLPPAPFHWDCRHVCMLIFCLFWKHKCRDFIAARVHSFYKDLCWIFLWGRVDFPTNYRNKSLKVCSCKFYHLTMRALFPV